MNSIATNLEIILKELSKADLNLELNELEAAAEMVLKETQNEEQILIESMKNVEIADNKDRLAAKSDSDDDSDSEAEKKKKAKKKSKKEESDDSDSDNVKKKKAEKKSKKDDSDDSDSDEDKKKKAKKAKKQKKVSKKKKKKKDSSSSDSDSSNDSDSDSSSDANIDLKKAWEDIKSKWEKRIKVIRNLSKLYLTYFLQVKKSKKRSNSSD